MISAGGDLVRDVIVCAFGYGHARGTVGHRTSLVSIAGSALTGRGHVTGPIVRTVNRRLRSVFERGVEAIVWVYGMGKVV